MPIARFFVSSIRRRSRSVAMAACSSRSMAALVEASMVENERWGEKRLLFCVDLLLLINFLSVRFLPVPVIATIECSDSFGGRQRFCRRACRPLPATWWRREQDSNASA